MCLEILSKMAYAQSKGAHASFYDEFQQCTSVCCGLLQLNWHHVQQQWVDGRINSQSNYLNRTNIRVESINAKMKMVITRHYIL